VPWLASAFGIFLMRQFFLGLPVELEEAALIDGCGRWRTFRSIVLPLARPALTTLAIITLLWSWNDLLWPLVAISDDTRFTLQVGLANFQGMRRTEWSQLMAGNVLATVPLILAFLFAQRKFIATMTFTGIKG
jgi:multiple sugar transport system permease protein